MSVSPVQVDKVDHLAVKTFNDRKSLGDYAGQQIARKIKELLQDKDEIRMVFAAAPSQNEVLQYLVQDKGIDWARIVAFHMDEYIGLAENAPQTFRNFLLSKLFDLVKPKEVHLINGNSESEHECRRYASLFNEKPIDIVCLGIGENGHLAFNDPPVANFEDEETVKTVTLDEACRQQQVNDGCFSSIEEVPEKAITLTIPALLSGEFLYCVVPGKTKASAVRHVLDGPITTNWPATILRNHPNCTLYLDKESCGGNH
ncbi:glucosamine-6-phosphate deaminase [Pseudalkalibacillus salsuginis]|uniref:glucosamine-6-phosphate deaminase n=1 Tax=Pseudalkalibacillus salsuginis TaxID=2910972 RepID=UPI001F2651D8|nr:glucosamine-6-phosphate deaminase [Pseudalkalibacillus salsuginis]MCF6411604.1 glucosamine-6-phosphate deaminase [Pseudalkalibacillus salsuginis]